jgi:hypothetical protein
MGNGTFPLFPLLSIFMLKKLARQLNRSQIIAGCYLVLLLTNKMKGGNSQLKTKNQLSSPFGYVLYLFCL